MLYWSIAKIYGGHKGSWGMQDIIKEELFD